MASHDDDSTRRRRREYDRNITPTSPRDRTRTHQKSASSSKIHLSSGVRRRSRSRDRDREREKEKEKEKERYRDRDGDRDSMRSGLSDRAERTRKVSMVVPEMERRPSSSVEVRSQASYPSFSKAHSREAIASREDVGSSDVVDPAQEASNDARGERDRRRNSTPIKPSSYGQNRTSSNPAPSVDAATVRRSNSGESMRGPGAESSRARTRPRQRSIESALRASQVRAAKSKASFHGLDADEHQSDLSSMPGTFPSEHRGSNSSDTFQRTASTTSHTQSNLSSTTITDDSDATSIAPERKGLRQPIVVPIYDHSPESVTDSQPRTPTGEQPLLTARRTNFDHNALKVSIDSPSIHGMSSGAGMAPPPPPPPPPPPVPIAPEDIPRVDYLLKNGGLPSMVPRRLVQLTPQVQQYATHHSPNVMQLPPLDEYARVFSTIHKRLDDYTHVLQNHGSLAVATGYKSVARRLLDKLSQVFARDISSQRCDCVICKTAHRGTISDEEDSGVSWGEILEYTAGRQELPQWPPFSMTPDDDGHELPGVAQLPMQKLDIDVPEEYRDHYIRQNQKTKRAVQTWLSQQPELPSSPPDEADEDTLMFAMMTRLNVQQRNYFIALMHGQGHISELRAPTPAERPTTSSTALKRARIALQRLYRLERPPRDCECAMYLLSNPGLHGMLATLAEVNDQEWNILVSGRFDGFLWSGAEQPMSASTIASPMVSRAPSRATNATPMSRNVTPFSGFGTGHVSRGPTPFGQMRAGMAYENPVSNILAPAPVQLDEETEIAVLAEVERNLFQDMERFEDAFELLHSRAEVVRQMLRERSAGLSMQAQLRRGTAASDAFVRLDTPASGFTDFDDEDDDGLGDTASLAPDDSASQISSNRRRRHHRERKTPAPVPEEDEVTYEQVDRRLSGRRSKY